MKLEQLLVGIEYECVKLPEQDINNITDDSRKAYESTLFVCIKGEKSDGHNFAKLAGQAGCVAVVAERQTESNLPHIIVKNCRQTLSLLCANFYSNPLKNIKLIGVTGTNGKTTTTYILKHILEQNGHKTGLIGTIQNMVGGQAMPASYTTPEPLELQKLFRDMANANCEYVVMEVSSQALAQERVFGCRFTAALFTNLTQDHLDYHKTMENYLAAKLKLFEQADLAVINLDDPYAQQILSVLTCRTVTYSARDMNADYTARNIKYRSNGTDYDVVGLGIIGRAKLGLLGSFNVYNTLVAISCAVTLGMPLEGVLDSLRTSKGVKGRVEVVPTGRDFSIIIDYAHTPDGLLKVLQSVNEFKQGRVVALFGCGGDRDKSKRPQMGRIAAENADFVIITSDNPRTEQPMSIIEEILQGIGKTKTPHITIENRKQAIKYAIENAQKDDIILLAGKGHEDYQIIGTEKLHLDEREVIEEVLKQSKD
jgi:UDP-N-acetylmuramoyl-L-alanyl-D-glutamate--2,6-diaminopimelate ligase